MSELTYYQTAIVEFIKLIDKGIDPAVGSDMLLKYEREYGFSVRDMCIDAFRIARFEPESREAEIRKLK